MKKIMRVLCFTCILFFAFTLNVNATISDISSCALSEERKIKLIRFADLELVSDDSKQFQFTCFDVDGGGNYALGFASSGDRGFAYVYSNDGNFLYGFSFNTNGAYGIELCEDGLGIFYGRENVILTYDRNGVCVDAQKLVATTSDHHTRIGNFLRRTSETVDGRQYSMQRDVNIGESYSRFVVTDADGTETILYQNPSGNGGEIIVIVSGALFLLLIAILVFQKCKEDDEVEQQTR